MLKRRTISKKERELILKKTNGRCAYCGEPLCRGFNIDHIAPFQYSRDDSFDNLMASCRSCNNYKWSWSLEQFRKEIESSVDKLRQYSVNFRFAERYGLIKGDCFKKVFFYFETLKKAD